MRRVDRVQRQPRPEHGGGAAGPGGAAAGWTAPPGAAGASKELGLIVVEQLLAGAAGALPESDDADELGAGVVPDFPLSVL